MVNRVNLPEKPVVPLASFSTSTSETTQQIMIALHKITLFENCKKIRRIKFFTSAINIEK